MKRFKRPSDVVPLSYEPPSPQEQMRSAAEHAAETAVRHHPTVKAIHRKMTRDLLRSMKKTRDDDTES